VDLEVFYLGHFKNYNTIQYNLPIPILRYLLHLVSLTTVDYTASSFRLLHLHRIFVASWRKVLRPHSSCSSRRSIGKTMLVSVCIRHAARLNWISTDTEREVKLRSLTRASSLYDISVIIGRVLGNSFITFLLV